MTDKTDDLTHLERIARAAGDHCLPRNWMPSFLSHGTWGDECIEWPFSKTKKGYGIFTHKNKRYPAHRFVLIQISGKNPEGLQAAHECGNPSCVNPNHLSWKTQIENEKDKIRHGTLRRGTESSRAKLTDADVLNIFASQEPQYALAERYGVHKATIQTIKSGKTWGWLTGRPYFLRGATAKQRDTLTKLVEFSCVNPNQWARPMDVGGSGSSGHDKLLESLSKRGVCEMKKFPSKGNRPVRKFRATRATQEFLRQQPLRRAAALHTEGGES